MADGPGKYEYEATAVLSRIGATTVLLMVFGGDRGDGFEVVSTDIDPRSLGERLPAVLRRVADDIEAGG